VRELGVGARGAVVTLGDVHRWPRARSRWGQDQESVRALLHAGLEGVRTALEAEAAGPVSTPAGSRREAVARLTDLHENALTQPIRGRVEAHPATCQD
jgi:hypothetical protein